MSADLATVPTAAEFEAANRRVKLYSDEQTAFMRSEKRTAMSSPLFDLPRRSALGWRFLSLHAAPVLRAVCAHATPEELAGRMRGIGRRPYQSQLSVLMSGCLGARQQRIIELGLGPGEPLPGEPIADLVFLTDFWERVQRTYRADGQLFPRAAGGATRVLEPQTVAAVAALLEPPSEAGLATLHRTAGLLQSYSLLLHGEIRDGAFTHGPYPLADGTCLVVKEFNDLRNDFLSWAPGAGGRLPLGNLAIAYALRDTELRCDMFGSAVTEPLNFDRNIAALAVLTSADGRVLEPLDLDAVAAAGVAAEAAQDEMFAAIVAWEEPRRVTYGAEVFANYLVAFAELAGARELIPEIRRRAEETVAHGAEDILGKPPWAVWKHMAEPGEAMFWPIVH